ncbi:hypothetical protein CSC3H3_12025 [Thalassospira marina]|uniref:DUF3817 domain-containing protein n=2 Tax=Thalassospira marina TaxID=2048283 RepID=A0ABN5FJZ6_9PROT|nr:hypothetical protein CSC3H3_12025 [Thalassospira marina]
MPGRMLRIGAMAEAVTLLLLVGIAVPLKHLAGIEEATRLMGPIHGVAFLFFAWLVIRARFEGLIDGAALGRLMIGAFIPFGGFVNERWLRTSLDQGKGQ